MSRHETELLKTLGSSDGYVACDGLDRSIAHELERLGLAEWGSQFWAITDAGRAVLLHNRG